MEPCKKTRCPWVKSSTDADYYVCLNCGRDRRVDSSEMWINSWIAVAIVIFLAVLLDSANQSPELPTQDTHTLPAQNE